MINILDIDMDVLYSSTYMGSMFQVNTVDKSADYVRKEVLQRFEKMQEAPIYIFERHHEVYYEIYNKYKAEELTIYHIDAHSDISPRSLDDPYWREIGPTEATWLSYAARDFNISRIYHITAAEKNLKHETILVDRGKKVEYTTVSMFSSHYDIDFQDIPFDSIYITKSKDWCNYSDEDLTSLMSTIKGER
jgi:hypothetical protein